MKNKEITSKLDLMIENPRCELNYESPWQLVISVMLSAQCTDKRVNLVTGKLYQKYSLKDLANLDTKIIEKEIRSLGSYTKKAQYLKQIAYSLYYNYDGKVPNNFDTLLKMPGIGRKCANVIISELFGTPTIAVDTHVSRVSKRLGLASENDDVLVIENKLRKIFNEKEYNKVNHQLVLFGRYICTAKKPNCNNCLFKCKNSTKF